MEVALYEIHDLFQELKILGKTNYCATSILLDEDGVKRFFSVVWLKRLQRFLHVKLGQDGEKIGSALVSVCLQVHERVIEPMKCCSVECRIDKKMTSPLASVDVRIMEHYNI